MENNNSPKGFRILLRVLNNEELQKRCFIFINFDKMKTINDVENHIGRLLGFKPISLYVRDAWLPKNETAQIITEKDILVARLNDDGLSTKQIPVSLDKKIKEADIPNAKPNTLPISMVNNQIDKSNKSANTNSNKNNKFAEVEDILLQTLGGQFDAGKVKKRSGGLLEDSMETLFEQLERKKEQFLKGRNESPATANGLSFLKDKITSTFMESNSNTIKDNPISSDSPFKKKKRQRKHKKSSKTLRTSDETESTVTTSSGELKLPYHGKHTRFCDEHENCFGNCNQTGPTTEKLEKKSKNVKKNNLASVKVVSEEIIATNVNTKTEVTVENVSNKADEGDRTIVDSTMEDVKSSQVSVENKTEEVDENKLMNTPVDDVENSQVPVENKSEEVVENEVMDILTEDVKNPQVIVEQEFGKAVENGSTADTIMEVGELNTETVENVTQLSIESATEVINCDESSYKGDENDDWKARLLNLAGEKDIESKIFHRQCAAASVL